MKFFSATQDFDNSVRALPELLSRLQYVSGLRDTEGYAHWGLVREHGKAAAEKAMRQAHQSLFLDLLRTPLRELAATARSTEEISALRAPEDLSGGSKRHFNSIVMVLNYFSAAEQVPAHPGA